MSNRIRIDKSGDRLTLQAPDHPHLASKAAQLGGRKQGGGWSFDAGEEKGVRKLARQLYGTDGTERETASLRVDLSLFGEGSLGEEGEAWLAGRRIARRAAFDGPVELGEGVKLVSGGFGVWGGSRAHPALDARYGTVVDIEGVPRGAADLAAERYPIAVGVVGRNGEAQVGPWSRTVVTRNGVEDTRSRGGRQGSAREQERDHGKAAKAGVPPPKAERTESRPAAAPAAASSGKSKASGKPGRDAGQGSSQPAAAAARQAAARTTASRGGAKGRAAKAEAKAPQRAVQAKVARGGRKSTKKRTSAATAKPATPASRKVSAPASRKKSSASAGRKTAPKATRSASAPSRKKVTRKTSPARAGSPSPKKKSTRGTSARTSPSRAPKRTGAAAKKKSSRSAPKGRASRPAARQTGRKSTTRGRGKR